MPKIKYQNLNISAKKLQVIEQANVIIAEYAAQGFDLTLRQLYYQFVARDLIPNRQEEYKKLGGIIGDGRLAGLIDWDAIVDRTRNLRALPHWDDPASIIESCAAQFRVDKWADQPYRVEVWIEKDALVGVIAGVCDSVDVPYFSCRGYTSLSEVWSAAMRIRKYNKAGQNVVVLHFGDHDPSGIDMTRDITERFVMFGARAEIRRLALPGTGRGQGGQRSPPGLVRRMEDLKKIRKEACSPLIQVLNCVIVGNSSARNLPRRSAQVYTDVIKGHEEKWNKPKQVN